MLHFVSSGISFLVLILACIGCALPKLWVNNYTPKANVCWYTTKVLGDGTTTPYYSGTIIEVGSPCEGSVDENIGLWKQCKKIPALVKDSCRGTATPNTEASATPTWKTNPDKKTGLSPGCLYKRPDDWTCKSTSELADQLEKGKTTIANLKSTADKSTGATKTAMLAAWKKADDSWNKTNDLLTATKVSQGLYVTSIVLQGLGFIASLAAIAIVSKKMPCLATAGLHILGGLFYMVLGAYMTAKFKDSRTEQNIQGNGFEDAVGAWDVTFAAAWTCWLFSWVCAALSFVQSTKADAAMEEKKVEEGTGNV
jgi:hypothetical protein